VRALQRHRGFHLRMVDDNQLQVVQLATGDHGEMVSFTGRAKILFIIVQSYLCRQKKSDRSRSYRLLFISTYLEM
jgi:hypothetical protein